MDKNPSIKTIDDISIFVTSDGKFEAFVDGNTVRRASLKAVEQVIKDRRSAILLMEICSYYNGRRRVPREIIGFDKGRPRTKDRELLKTWNSRFYICTDEQIKAIDALIAEQEQLNQKWEELTESLQDVNEYNFSKIQNEVGKNNGRNPNE